MDEIRGIDRRDIPQVRVGQSALRNDGGLFVEVAAELKVEIDPTCEVWGIFRLEDLQQGQVEVLEVGTDVVRPVEEPHALSRETLGASAHEDPVE